ncbi:hypothetical protein SHKM778_81660 [Streptomyces sp. KM77-8]|uniref:Uncharacterized protein n=1 Tax=Streptomyces haneummycinicus TaxID=3074435 RepID=A0AAT9HX30_9ACTN
MYGLHGFAGRGDEIDDMPEPPLVLEGQIRRIIEVDMRLGRVVDQQRPPAHPIPIGDEPGDPAVDPLDDTATTGLLTPCPAHPAIVPGDAPSPSGATPSPTGTTPSPTGA